MKTCVKGLEVSGLGCTNILPTGLAVVLVLVPGGDEEGDAAAGDAADDDWHSPQQAADPHLRARLALHSRLPFDIAVGALHCNRRGLPNALVVVGSSHLHHGSGVLLLRVLLLLVLRLGMTVMLVLIWVVVSRLAYVDAWLHVLGLV